MVINGYFTVHVHVMHFSGISPSEIDVIELHDCFSCNELITYEALGLCAPGKYYPNVFTLKCLSIGTP